MTIEKSHVSKSNYPHCVLIATVASATSLMCSASMAQNDQERKREFRFAITEIPGLGGGLDFARGMNDHGHVVGESLTADNSELHPFVWNGRATRDLGTFGGNRGRALDINEKGWVVGWAEKGTHGNRAFLWRGGGPLVDIGDLGGSAAATAINNRGQIVGSSNLNGIILHAFLWNGEMIDLGTLEGFGDSVAEDINEQGFVVGWSNTTKNNHAFLWRDGDEMINLGSLGGGEQRSEPAALNESLVVVGWGNVNNRSQNWRRPFAYHDGEWHNLVRPITDKGFSRGTSWDVNNANQIVGEVHHDKTDKWFGFIWQGGDGIQLIDDLLPPHSDWRVRSATAINEHGQIAGNADLIADPTGSHMLLLTPIDPELTLEIADGPLQADAINTLRITGAQAGATIKFFYGKKGGGKRIPGCDALEAMTQIDDPVLFGEAIADADGNAELDIYIPPHGAAHKGFLIQAVDFDHCEESQLVLKKVE